MTGTKADSGCAWGCIIGFCTPLMVLLVCILELIFIGWRELIFLTLQFIGIMGIIVSTGVYSTEEQWHKNLGLAIVSSLLVLAASYAIYQ
jgi:hypothetical protein